MELSVLATAKPVVKVVPHNPVPQVLRRSDAPRARLLEIGGRCVCQFTKCPPTLRAPKRVHLDAYGHMISCQGLSMGCIWRMLLSKLVGE